MTNPFIEKAKKQEKNPFIEKAVKNRSSEIARQIADKNYRKLLELLNSYGPKDNQEARERIRLRVIEAKAALDACR